MVNPNFPLAKGDIERGLRSSACIDLWMHMNEVADSNNAAQLVGCIHGQEGYHTKLWSQLGENVWLACLHELSGD